MQTHLFAWILKSALPPMLVRLLLDCSVCYPELTCNYFGQLMLSAMAENLCDTGCQICVLFCFSDYWCGCVICLTHAGLNIAIKLLSQAQKKFPEVSWADLMQMSSAAAIKVWPVTSCGHCAPNAFAYMQ